MEMAAKGECWRPFCAYRCLGLLLGVALLSGCGDEGNTYPVRGKVTYQGQPVPHGTVMLNPTSTELPVAMGRIGSDGTYEVLAAPGEYKVVVTVVTEVDPASVPDDPLHKPPASLVPEKYSNPLTTPLQASVVEGANTVDLEL